MEFSPDSTTLAAGEDTDEPLRFWNVTTGQTTTTLTAGFMLRFSPDGKVLATASADKTVRLWQLN